MLACSLARGDEPPSDAAVVLPEVVVRVPAARPEPRDPTAATTAVDAERVAGEARELGALLTAVPGVVVDDHGPGSIEMISIRGSTPGQVKVFLDGLPLDTAAGGGVDLASIPPQWISRLDVVRGVSGAYAGSGALGGSVNLVTAPVRPGEWGAAVTGGSFGTWRADGHAAAGGERWGVLGAAAASATDGRFEYRYDPTPELPANGDTVTRTRTHDGSEVAGGLLKGWALLGANRFEALAQVSSERRDLPGWPYDPTPDDWQSESRALAAVRWRRLAGDGLVLSAGAHSRVDQLDARLAYLGGATVRQRGLEGGGDAELRWSGDAGVLSVRAEGSGEGLQADGIGDRSRASVAGAIAGELPLGGGRWRLAPAVRVERTGGFDALSGQLGAMVRVAGPVSLRANAGRSVRVPSFTELYLQQGLLEPNPNLRPEVGLGGDAAVVVEGDRGRVSAGGFATLYSDVIVYQAASFRRLSPVNDARALARGAELEAATAPLPRLLGLSASAAYTLLLTETLRGPDAVLGRELPRRPRHRVHGRLELGGAPAEAHAEVDWTSQQWLDLENTQPIPAALCVGLGGSIRLVQSPPIRIHLDVRNLLDDRSLQDGYGNPLPGRMVLLTLRAGSPSPGER